MPAPAYKLSVSSSDGDTLLRILDGDTVAASVRLVPVDSGHALERLYVEEGYRGQGLARALLRVGVRRAGGAVCIKPRPFGDMPTSIEGLKELYASEGFELIDGKDNMVYTGKTKVAKAEGGFYNGKAADPDTVKKVVDFQGLEIKLDRPKGFVMYGRDSKGKPWRRTYKYDYGFIPQTLGGDNDGLDVFIGPDKDAKDSYWVVQTKPDGSFDEYKVFLGFENEDAAKAAYAQHIPQKLMHEVSAMSIEMMKAMLGVTNPQESVKSAMWRGFCKELLDIRRP